MTQNESVKTAVPVDMLRLGLYVSALDRPWIETPFLFQGFRIVGREELRALRKYCRFVYVDMERSDGAVRKEVEADLRQSVATSKPAVAVDAAAQPSRPPSEAVEQSAGVLFEGSPHPDYSRFATLVQDAHATRHEARRILEDSFRRAVRGESLDCTAIRETAAEVAAQVMRDPSAALWLTHLRDRDTYLSTHSFNTCVLAVALGAQLGIKGNALCQLGQGALLHAVGKLRIPARILNKRGSLSIQEMDRVRRYPELGHEMLSANGGIPPNALDTVRFHQERWGGEGYPDGLIGDSIPRNAQIVGLVQSYDAMTRDRPYRAAKSPDVALHELYRSADRDFSASLVQAFICRIGTFPVGTVVELDNSAVGVVVATRPGSGLRPTLLMIRTPQGEPYRERLLLNLAARGGRSVHDLANRHVRRSLPARKAGIDLSAVIAEKGRVAA